MREFGEEDIRRIIRSVLRTEGSRLPGMRAENTALDNVDLFQLGMTSAPINVGASGTVTILQGTTKGSETFSGAAVTAYNRFANVRTGSLVIVVWLLGGWELIAAQC